METAGGKLAKLEEEAFLYGDGNNKPNVTNKCPTMTGICIHGDELEERSAELLEIMDK